MRNPVFGQTTRRLAVLCIVAAACGGCQRRPVPISLSLPAPSGAGRVEILLPQLAALAPPSTATLCESARQPSGSGEAPDTFAARRARACASSAPDGYDAFVELAAAAPPTRAGRLDAATALLEALRRAGSAREARIALNILGVDLREAGTALGEPPFYTASAEVFDRLSTFCTSDNPDCHRAIFLKTGKSFVEAGRWHGDTEALHQAIAFLDRARAETKPDDTDHMTSVLNALGNAYAYDAELFSGKRRRDELTAAATAYEGALPALDKGPHDFDWAMIHHNLGTIYDARNKIDEPGDQRDAHLDRAIAEVEMALTVWTRDKHPGAWASANDNLGSSVFRRGEQRGQRPDLDRGIDILRQSLAVRTDRKAKDPLPWAYSTLALARHLIDRADIVAAQAPEAADADRAEARRLLEACEPLLRAAKAESYLATWERQRKRLSDE